MDVLVTSFPEGTDVETMDRFVGEVRIGGQAGIRVSTGSADVRANSCSVRRVSAAESPQCDRDKATVVF
jgi:hypothetical protein